MLSVLLSTAGPGSDAAVSMPRLTLRDSPPTVPGAQLDGSVHDCRIQVARLP